MPTLTIPEYVSELRQLGPQSLDVYLHHLADHLYQLRLAGGQRLNDAIDFSLALRELAEAWKMAESKPLSVAGEWCPDCGHIHIDPAECGFPTGGGRVCRCERKVLA